MSKEQFYDERIAPLMRKVSALCREAGIAHAASFDLDGVQANTFGPVDDMPNRYVDFMRACGEGDKIQSKNGNSDAA